MTTQGCHWTGAIEAGDTYTLRVPRAARGALQVLVPGDEWRNLAPEAQQGCSEKLRTALFDAISTRWRPHHADVLVTFGANPTAQCVDRPELLPAPVGSALARVLLLQVLVEKRAS